VVAPCEPTQFAFNHTLPKKSKQKQVEFQLPDAPF